MLFHMAARNSCRIHIYIYVLAVVNASTHNYIYIYTMWIIMNLMVAGQFARCCLVLKEPGLQKTTCDCPIHRQRAVENKRHTMLAALPSSSKRTCIYTFPHHCSFFVSRCHSCALSEWNHVVKQCSFCKLFRKVHIKGDSRRGLTRWFQEQFCVCHCSHLRSRCKHLPRHADLQEWSGHSFETGLNPWVAILPRNTSADRRTVQRSSPDQSKDRSHHLPT